MASTTTKPVIPVDQAKFDALGKRVDELRKLDNKNRVINVDVLIVGSGPIGAVYARKLIDYEGKTEPANPTKPGFKVGQILMVDMGAQESRRIGDHHKNSVVVQKDLSLFTNTIKGQESPLSVANPDPNSKKFIYGNHNPQQKPEENLSASAATRVVGGMSTHWTCCTPRQHPHERSKLFTDKQWESMYGDCEQIFNTNKVHPENSVRHRLVKYMLEDAFQRDFKNGVKKPRQKGPREVRSMPLAGKTNNVNKSYTEWTCTATILNDLADPLSPETRFRLMQQTQCDVLYIDALTGKVKGAIIIDLVNNKEYLVQAKKYVVCGGAVLTGGIVAKSVFKSGLTLEGFCPALGKYLTEQTMSFCQITLKQEFIDDVIDDPGFLDNQNEDIIAKKVKAHIKKHPEDPIPFPFDDFDPQVYTPFSDNYPWHTQIHRDAFGYGELPPNIDPRTVVDLRFFGLIESRESNRVTWDPTSKDAFGMPQPTFSFQLTDHDKSQAERMKKDMTHVAEFLGDYIPGSEPQALAPGLALHICGIYRAGEKPGPGEKPPTDISVVSREGKVWHLDNLYLGGCGIIPVSNASNPTITAACHALASAKQIGEELEALQKAKPGK
ncbi:hypothetical protein F4859DRAFT_516145 [Xylaria cf. heliscus]|nr:hypothetical protein F4859DRAFT_516145 [Xylaria cf. heliscus]